MQFSSAKARSGKKSIKEQLILLCFVSTLVFGWKNVTLHMKPSERYDYVFQISKLKNMFVFGTSYPNVIIQRLNKIEVNRGFPTHLISSTVNMGICRVHSGIIWSAVQYVCITNSCLTVKKVLKLWFSLVVCGKYNISVFGLASILKVSLTLSSQYGLYLTGYN